MAPAQRVYESDDDYAVPHPKVKTKDPETGIECLSTTKRVMNKVDENRVLITLWIAIVTFVASQILMSRDSTQQQPLVDKMQDFRIEKTEEHLLSMDRKLDDILKRLPK